MVKKTKYSRNERQQYSSAPKTRCVVGVCGSVRLRVTRQKIESQSPKQSTFRHQQSHSVALPNLLFGHNYSGFVGAIEWLLKC